MKNKQIVAFGLVFCLAIGAGQTGTWADTTLSEVETKGLVIEESCEESMEEAELLGVEQADEVRVLVELSEGASMESVLSALSELTGSQVDYRYSYDILLEGFATEIPYGLLAEAKELSGVKDILLEETYEPAAEEEKDASLSVENKTEASLSTSYTGLGSKIAIIDTGLDLSSDYFAALAEDKLSDKSVTEDELAGILPELNAYAIYEAGHSGEENASLAVDQVYYNSKVAFGFNYVDGDTNIGHDMDDAGDHGTNVAALAAGNDVENSGGMPVESLASDAQIFVMKVFGASGGAYTSDILAALEDSIRLGADVVNLSLGDSCGFMTDSDEIQEIYNIAKENGLVLVAAVGNKGTSSELASMPDLGTISSPASYQSTLGVASAAKPCEYGFTIEIGGKQYLYSDAYVENDEEFPVMSSMLYLDTAKKYEYVILSENEMTASNLKQYPGKIIVTDLDAAKAQDYYDMIVDTSCQGLLLVDKAGENEGLALSHMEELVPCAVINMLCYEAMLADKSKTLQVSSDITAGETNLSDAMSAFSSWGVTPELTLGVDLTAYGENIFTVGTDNSTTLVSGSSFAAPQVAAASAILMQYVRENYPALSREEEVGLVENLLMSTANPVLQEGQNSLYLSPRQQGAGLMEITKALEAKAYLTGLNGERPSIELGDDVEKKGSYQYSFLLKNDSSYCKYYDVKTCVEAPEASLNEASMISYLTGAETALDADTSYSSSSMAYVYDYYEDETFDSMDAYKLWQQVEEENKALQLDVNEDGLVSGQDVQEYLDALTGKSGKELDRQALKVNAGESARIDVSFDLQDSAKEYLDAYFENGSFVEGYSFLTSLNEDGIDLSLPFMGFYGDWTMAPQLDAEQGLTLYLGRSYSTGVKPWQAGKNPYISKEEVNEEHQVISLDSKSKLGSLYGMKLGLLRNASTIELSFMDGDSFDFYGMNTLTNVRKDENTENNYLLQKHLAEGEEVYSFTDLEGNTLADGTKILVSANTSLAFASHEAMNLCDNVMTSLRIDSSKPKLTGADISQKDGKNVLSIQYTDNQDVAAVLLQYKDASGKTKQVTYATGNRAESGIYSQTIDVTKYGESFTLILADYAMNEKSYTLSLSNSQ